MPIFAPTVCVVLGKCDGVSGAKKKEMYEYFQWQNFKDRRYGETFNRIKYNRVLIV